ncbi:MAG: hypothetical protein H6657_30050 [Ardenticatenaceae bacterium]|nr:hypothetical protein [Ardenticatenaceae bacterium]
MRKNRSTILALVLLFLLCGSLLAMSSTNYQVNWMVPLSGGGGGHASSTTYLADYTVGQTAVGGASSSSYQARLGFWPSAGGSSRYTLYLPLITK